MNRWILMISALLLSGSALAQVPKMEPGEAHRRLDFLVGHWTIQSSMHMRDEVHTAEHEAEVRWLPGGVWLEESVDMPATPIGDMYGSARIAWDAAAGEYVRYWIDNQSHVVLPMRGKFIDDSTLEFKGSFEWTDGTVYHQRLVVRATEDGWSQTGFMGVEPEKLRLNHEGRAVRRVESAAAPPWFAEHLKYMTRGTGRWIADNATYRLEQEPFEAYVTEWTWGTGKQSIRGRLFGLTDGEESVDFWEFRLAWHPDQGHAVVQQFGIAGVVGSGPMESTGPRTTRMDQTFHGLDGTRFRTVHHSEETSDEVHTTESFEVAPDGSLIPRRKYTWRLAPAR